MTRLEMLLKLRELRTLRTIKGERGEAGPVGPQGPPGERGEHGPMGLMGPIGLIGPEGPRGHQGERGERGEPGHIGPVGLTGPRGQRGEQGATGPQGEPGKGFRWRGSWTANATYQPNDCVEHLGSTFVATGANMSPPGSGPWELMAAKGQDGWGGGGDAAPVDLSPVEDRLDVVEAAASALDTSVSTLDGRVDTAETDIVTLDSRVDSLEAADVSLDSRLDTAEGSITTLQGSSHAAVTLAAVGSSPAAEGASLSGQVLTLQPADSTHSGVITTIAQTWAGLKTFVAGIALQAKLAITTISSGNAIEIPGGTKLHFNGGSGNEYIYRSASNTLNVADGGSVVLTFGTGMNLGFSGYGGSNSAWTAQHGTGWALGNTQVGHAFDASFGANSGYIMNWKKDTTIKAALATDGSFEQRPVTTVPAAPASGSTLFSREISGRTLPWAIGKRGSSFALQPSMAGAHMAWARSRGGSATVDVCGITITSNGAAAAAQTPAVTNILTQTKRTRFAATGSTANTLSCGLRDTIRNYWRGDIAGLGGFYFVTRVANPVTIADFRLFVGLSNTTGVLGSSADPSSFTDLVGFGLDAADANVQFMHNDNAGTATKSSTGLGRPGTTEVWEFQMYCVPNGSSVYMRAEKLNSGVAAVEYEASTNLPAASTLLGLHIWGNNGPTGGVTTALDFAHVYIESDF